MNDSEPPSSDGQFPTNQPTSGQPKNGQSKNGAGSLARLRALLRLWRRPRRPRGPKETRDALIAAADLDSATPITPQERFLIGNILTVHERNAADVMVPRVDIVALDVEQPFAEVVKCMVEHGHSRVPVYRESLDDVIGFIHVKDVLAPVADRRPAKLSRLLRKVLFVAPSLPILDLLVQMRQARTHIAVVVDEFGGIDGLVTIEDLIEEIVGEIEDEHDVAEPPTLIERPDGTVIADARIPIEALEEQHNTRLRPVGDEEAVDTLGGLVFTLAGRVPKRGEVITHPDGIEFEVLDADPRRVKRLRVRGLPAANGGGRGGAPGA
jgi:magnesium and cobalt transporter